MSRGENYKFGHKIAFKNTSLLWKALRQEVATPGSVKGSGTLSSEAVFYTFNVYAAPTHDKDLNRHCHAWLSGMKDCFFEQPERWKKLVSDLSTRPGASSSWRPLAPGASLTI